MNRLEQIAKQIQGNSQPPVDKWIENWTGKRTLETHGEIDIRIDNQGHWFHEGEPIGRDKLVCLFASILWCENDKYYLVTPAEKLQINVEDVPYLVHQMEHVDGAWVAVTNTHEQVIISESNPVGLRLYKGQLIPYVNVRYDLWARVNRSIYYQWAELAIDEQNFEDAPLELQSNGYRFEVAKVAN